MGQQSSEPARRYALRRIDPGDYLCSSNDGVTLWRFSRYEDGMAHGLMDAAFERRSFWRARQAPMPAGGVVERDEVENLLWREVGVMLASRRAAIDVMLGEPDGSS